MPEVNRTKITLERPIFDGNNVVISEITLRDPLYQDFMILGEPWYLNFTPDGRPYPWDNEPTIAAYVERCLVEPKGYLAIANQMTVKDAQEIKKWMRRFFRGGVVVPQGPTEDSTTPSPTLSTDTSASPSATPSA